MNISLAVTIVLSLLAGVILALKVIAPLTATKADDAVLARLEAVEDLVKKLQG